ncbi:MAG: GntR family transcriptional regulator [Acetobacteraceae bacterium]
MLGPLNAAPSLIDQTYRRVLDAIADGTLSPGQRIRQAELADTLGVSRQPISHALHLLKRQGLVEDSGRRGLRVVPIDAARVAQLYQVRAAIDVLAAGLAARRVAMAAAPGNLLDRLGSQVRDAAGFDTTTPISVLVRADADFHRSLYDLSGNPAMGEMTAPLWPQLMRSMATILHAPGYAQRIWQQEHPAILRAILAGDADAAEAAARRHANSAGQMTAAHFAQAA